MNVRYMSVLLLLLWAIPALGSSGYSVGVYADPAGASCNIIDDQAGVLHVYVVLTGADGATGAEFSAPKPDCMADALWLSDSGWPIVIGNSQSGVSVGFGECVSGPTSMLEITYFVRGTTAPCCDYPVGPNIFYGYEEILVVDCADNLLPALGEVNVVNGDASCPCGLTVPVEETTWGHVKALFE